MKKRTSASVEDLAFLLLLFFMVLALSTTKTPEHMQLPQSQHSNTIEDAVVEVVIMNNGNLYYNHMPITADQLPVTEQIKLFIDKDIPYSTIDPILKQLSQKTETIHIITGAADVND